MGNPAQIPANPNPTPPSPDYDALAAKYGGTVSPDYDALAAKYGGVSEAAPAPKPAAPPNAWPDMSKVAGAEPGAPAPVAKPPVVNMQPESLTTALGVDKVPAAISASSDAAQQHARDYAHSLEHPGPELTTSAERHEQQFNGANPPGAAQPDYTDTMAVRTPKGLVKPGNLPIWDRPVVQNADGTHSSEYSVSFQDDNGHEVLVPTVVNGRFLTPDGKKPPEGSPQEQAMFHAAWQHYLTTGQNLGSFDGPENADAYAQTLHNRGQKPAPAPSGNVIQAHVPTAGENLKAAVFGGSFGRAIAQTMPKLAEKLGIVGEQQNYGKDEALHPAELFQGFGRPAPNVPANKAEDLLTGVGRAAGGLTTGQSLAMMAGAGILPEWMAGTRGAQFMHSAISAGFTAQMLVGLYQHSKQFREQMDKGDSHAAFQTLGEMGVDGVMAFLAGRHAVETATSAVTAPEPPPDYRTSTEVAHDKLYPNETPEQAAAARADENKSRVVGHTAEGKPIEEPAFRGEVLAPEPKAPPAQPPGEAAQPIGTTDEETGRTVLQASENPEVNQERATAEHPQVKQGLEQAIADVQGAKLAGARDEKDADRLQEKIEGEGQSPETARDYSGFRIAVDSPAAHQQVANALRQQFEVPEETDEFEKGAEDTGFHGHTMQVRVPGSPVTHEVQILPRDVADAAEGNHPLYEKARDGDKEAAAQLKAKNEQDWEAFQQRNAAPPQNSVQASPAKSATKTEILQNRAQNIPENIPGQPINEGGILEHGQPDILNPATTEPTKYKFGSTQANVPAESDAAQALAAARGKIDKADLVSTEYGGNSEGVETEPHVTLRYGHKGDDTAGLRAYLEKQAPFEAKLGRTAAFPPSESSDGAAPIIAPVESPELHRMEAEIDNHGDFAERTFPEYKPHATLGYVKPETAQKYVGMPETEGKTFRVDSITISGRNGEQEIVPLRGTNPEREGGRGEAAPMQRGPVAREPAESPEPLPGAAHTAAPDNVPAVGTVGAAPVNALAVDPKRFQYKLNTDATGTTSLLKGRRWNPELADTISVWTDPGDGKTYVINGHHRFDLARQNGVPRINVMHIQAPDAASARAIGAIQNIAEGRGTPIDAAKFFRDSGFTPQDLDRLGVSMGEATAANGVALARLDDRLFDDVVSGKLRQGRAIAIGKATDKPTEQQAILKLIDKAESRGRRVTDDTVEELARMARSAGEHRETQTDLFGTSETSRNLALEKAEASAYIRDQIGKERRLFASVADEGKAARLALGKNKINAKTNAKIATEAAQAQELYDRLSTRSGPVDDILNRAAAELAEGKDNANAVKTRAYEAVRRTLSETVGRAAGSEPEGLRAGPAGAEAEPSYQLKPPRPPQRPETAWKKGDAFLASSPDGRMVSGTIEHYNPGINGGKAGGRARLADGSKLDAIPSDARPIQTIDSKIGAITGDAIEQDTKRQVQEDQPRLIQEYIASPGNNKDGVLTIATDAAKELFQQFRDDPTGADRSVAAAASRINKAVLKNALAHPVDPKRPLVQIPTASPGSGKTFTNANSEGGEIGLKIESIMDDHEAATKLLNQILDSGRTPLVEWVYVDDIGKTVERMFKRAIGSEEKRGIGRTVQLNYMLDSYKSIPPVLERLQKEFAGRVHFRVIDNSGPKGSIPSVSENLQPHIDDINAQPYNEVRRARDGKVEELRQAGLFESERGQRALAAAQTTDRPDAQNPREAGSGSGNAHGSGNSGTDGEDLQRQSGLRSPVLAEQENPTNAAAEPGGESVFGDAEDAGKFEKGIEPARKRNLRENAALHQARAIDTSDGGRAALLDADAYALWHRTGLGDKVAWRGATPPRDLTNKVLLSIRGAAGTARSLPNGGAAAAGYDRLAKTLSEARNPDGSLTLLRGDWRPDTLREERWHQWQRQHRIDESDAIREVARRPEFKRVADRLREMQYGSKPGLEGRTELALEMMGKALGGDPDLELTPEERNDLVQQFARAAAEEFGPSIFQDMPEAAPGAAKAIREVQREYEPSNEEVRGRALREQGAGELQQGEERPGVERSPLHGRGQGEPAPGGDERGGEGGAPPQGELNQRLPGEVPFPGMEDTVREQDEAAAVRRGEELSKDLLRPGKDISSRSGQMERESPLFRETEANPQFSLFQAATAEHGPVARAVQDLIDEIEKMPRPQQGTRLDQVAEWMGRKGEESLDRTAKSWSGASAKVEKAAANTKLLFSALVDDFVRPPEETDFKREVGQMQLARTETALKLLDLAKEIKQSVPDRTARIAMTHYREANGDPQKLREWAIKAKQRWETRDDGKLNSRIKEAWRDAVEHYEAATKLTPEQKALADRIGEHLSEMLKTAKAEGLLELGARNYVRHLYERTPESEDLLHLVDNSELDPNPSFIQHRVWQNYFDAETAGLVPKNKDIGYLLAAYDKSFSEALASRTMLKNLLDSRGHDGRPLAAIKMRGKWVMVDDERKPLVLQQRERPKTLKGYREFDLPQTRNFLFEPTSEDLEGFDADYISDKTGELAFHGDLIFHPEIADRIEDMLRPGWFDRNQNWPQKLGHAVMRGSAVAKETMTAVAPFHMVQEGIHSMEHGVNPFKLPKIDLSDPRQRLLASNGLALTDFDAEGLFSARALKGLAEGVPGLNVAMDALNNFSRWQFEEYIPQLKMRMALKAFARNRKRYPSLTDRQVAELTAKESNAAFGNLNSYFDNVHRSKTFKQLLRLTLFAPDFLEARMRFIGQAFTRFGGEQRAALLKGALVMYAIARIWNALVNQGDAKWNPEDAFSVIAGGRRYSLRTVQGDIMHAVTDPRGFIYNRLNPLTSRVLVEYLSGRDQFGRQKSFPHQVRDIAKRVLPFGVQKVIETGDEGWLDSLLTSTGLQASNYRTPAEEETHKLYLQGLPDFPDDEEREAASRKYKQLEIKLRENEIKPADVWAEVRAGDMTPKQAGRTIVRAQHSELYNEYRSQAIKLPDAMDIFEKASPVEKMELRPALIAKGEHQLPEMLPDQREKMSARWRQLIQSTPGENAGEPVSAPGEALAAK